MYIYTYIQREREKIVTATSPIDIAIFPIDVAIAHMTSTQLKLT